MKKNEMYIDFGREATWKMATRKTKTKTVLPSWDNMAAL
jgi:hypothetical protein